MEYVPHGIGFPAEDARKLERELTAAREEIEMLGIRYAAAEMHHANNMDEVTKQRDALAVEIGKWEQTACDKLSEICRQIEKTRIVTEQRDEARRLAERYRDLSCDTLEKADETLLPWEITTPNEL
jgi:hypothetical protein